MVSAALTFGVVIVGNFNADLKNFETVIDSQPMVWLAKALYYALPNLAPFDVKAQVVHAQPVPFGYIGLSVGYAGLYVGMLLLARDADLLAPRLQMSASLFTNRGRSGVFTILGLVGLLAAASVFVQMTRDRWYHTDQPARADPLRALGRGDAPHGAVVRRARRGRLLDPGRSALRRREAAPEGERKYELLYPLLDLTTSLDTRFNIAYRFGSLFLAEPSPGGPGRPDLAIALLQKGIKEMPEKWEYYQDAGFVYYFGFKDYDKAAEWFKRGSEQKGAPWFMKSLAANTLAKGHDRKASRLMYQVIAETADNDFMKKDAIRRLRQLDTMDYMDMLRDVVRRYRARARRHRRCNC